MPEVQQTDKVDDHRNLVDVNEIEGFEVADNTFKNSGQDHQIEKGNPSNIKSNPRITLQRSKQVDYENTDKMVDSETGQGISNGNVDGGQLPDESLREYSSNYLQQQGSASSAVGSVGSDPENESVSENIEVSSLGDESDEEKSEQEWKDSENEFLEREQKNSQVFTGILLDRSNKTKSA